MRTYVTSLHSGTIKTHIGNANWTACGTRIRAEAQVTPEVPPGLILCALCVSAYGSSASGFTAQRHIRVLELLCEGRADDEVALMLDMGLRTVVRHVARAQQELGAMTRLHLGYLLGRAEKG